MNKIDKKRVDKAYLKIDSIAKKGMEGYIEYKGYIDELIDDHKYYILEEVLERKYKLDTHKYTPLDIKSERVYDIIRLHTISNSQNKLKSIYDQNQVYAIGVNIYQNSDNQKIGEIYDTNYDSLICINQYRKEFISDYTDLNSKLEKYQLSVLFLLNSITTSTTTTTTTVYQPLYRCSYGTYSDPITGGMYYKSMELFQYPNPSTDYNTFTLLDFTFNGVQYSNGESITVGFGGQEISYGLSEIDNSIYPMNVSDWLNSFGVTGIYFRDNLRVIDLSNASSTYSISIRKDPVGIDYFYSSQYSFSISFIENSYSSKICEIV